MDERRRHVRSRVYYGARIAFNRHRSAMSCVLRNFSEHGARAEIETPGFLSGDFDLVIDHTGVAFRARMVWQRDHAAGFAFDDPRRKPVVMPPDLEHRLRAAERANKTLRQRIEQLSGGY